MYIYMNTFMHAQMHTLLHSNVRQSLIYLRQSLLFVTGGQ